MYCRLFKLSIIIDLEIRGQSDILPLTKKKIILYVFHYILWLLMVEINFLTIVFIYPQGNHNVIKRDGTGFQQCAASTNVVPLITGNDVINLTTLGQKWYICGVAKHCESGNQKLAIIVTESSCSPPSTTMGSFMLLAIMGFIIMMMV